jgi:hypothetical protein
LNVPPKNPRAYNKINKGVGRKNKRKEADRFVNQNMIHKVAERRKMGEPNHIGSSFDQITSTYTFEIQENCKEVKNFAEILFQCFLVQLHNWKALLMFIQTKKQKKIRFIACKTTNFSVFRPCFEFFSRKTFASVRFFPRRYSF